MSRANEIKAQIVRLQEELEQELKDHPEPYSFPPGVHEWPELGNPSDYFSTWGLVKYQEIDRMLAQYIIAYLKKDGEDGIDFDKPNAGLHAISNFQLKLWGYWQTLRQNREKFISELKND